MKKVYCDICGKEITKDDDNAQAWLKIIIKLISMSHDAGPWKFLPMNNDICTKCATKLKKFIKFLKEYPHKAIYIISADDGEVPKNIVSLAFNYSGSYYNKSRDEWHIQTNLGIIILSRTTVDTFLGKLLKDATKS